MTHPTTTPPTSLASALNQSCYCRTLDAEQLRFHLARDPTLRNMAYSIGVSHPHLFSNTAVFLSAQVIADITHAVQAIERVFDLPSWRQHALANAAAIGQEDHGPVGVLMGYDFHIGGEGAAVHPQLIEINTNAGGALLNVALVRAQHACCAAMDIALNGYRDLRTLDDDLLDMFASEWRLQRGTRPLKTIAIVDDDPANQYLAPEFELFKHLFATRGLRAVVADARELELRDGTLFHGDLPIDLVYNRVTDFDLSDPAHETLAQAYASGAAVVTPHPRAHTLRANKQHLVTLGDAQALQQLGVVPADQQTVLRVVPASVLVRAGNPDDLWARRRQLFFKPLDGFGARAVYRGDKLTKKVWEQILAGDYIAQELVVPGTRAMEVDTEQTTLKFDVRAYTYGGKVLLLAARTYNGQTTNFRTAGGGFAPVMLVPDLPLRPTCGGSQLPRSATCR